MLSHKHTHTPTDLIAGPAFEAVRVELVDMENMNGALDAEVMQLAGHFKEQQVILRWREDKEMRATKTREREREHPISAYKFLVYQF